MGTQLRMVPANWEHPKDDGGNYIPHHEHFPYTKDEVKEGLEDGWLTNEPPYYGVNVMPQWPTEERTHYQMYENTTEGTPISPVMDKPERLARWLADNRAKVFADQTASYESWLGTINSGIERVKRGKVEILPHGCVRTTYVEFLYPGLLMSESSSQEVASRDLLKLEVPENAFGFRFFDVLSMTVEVEGEEVELTSKTLNKSATHYYGGTVYTAAQIKRQFPDEKILISNIEGNRYKKVIKCRTGNWQPFQKDDVLVEEAVKV